MMNKNALRKMKKRYIKIPSSILKIDMSCGAKVLFLYLASLPEEVYPSVKDMAQALNITKKTVYSYLDEMVDNKIIEKISDGFCVMKENEATKWSVGKYKFINPENWE